MLRGQEPEEIAAVMCPRVKVSARVLHVSGHGRVCHVATSDAVRQKVIRQQVTSLPFSFDIG